MDIISTRAVAEVLGVSEATVKRWSDAGTLRCFRTAGGHRKFRLRDVKAFLADQDEPAPSAPAGPLTPDQLKARGLALAGDVDGLVSLVASQRILGISLAQALEEVFRPATDDIAQALAQGKLSPAEEKVAQRAVEDARSRVRPLAG